ncbi:hypothetical protein EIN_487310 [Entamoeba invadens IP1]|uniref:non-specific serine/threonine protein kinase n=1 Tax=Entamoeba invadens IP1 TaxID=370355 RepID=A0A0A1U4Y9_ENTIV|nr:hypothetical protein EIN_487310 [Entamoeba invadens IP1]ELP89249.1 hypothetical protein EIN_487310 [Entamoeba invadens IP1]|eukprot:XP_004256020.1 hypothetical protein EIN_487310 [Entamoeba invadens IP1]
MYPSNSSSLSSQIEPEIILGSEYNDWVLTSPINSGSFGHVYICQNKLDPTKTAAIKIFHSPSNGEAEVSILERFNHAAGVINMIDYGDSRLGYYIVMDLQGIDLSTFTRKLPTHRLTVGSTYRVFLRIMKILQLIHNEGIVHGDIKPANFVIKDSSDIVLIDFGLAETITDVYGNTRRTKGCGFRGTPRYAAPNVHLGNAPTQGDDTISAFYIFFENFCGKLDWDGLEDEREIYRKKVEFRDKTVYDIDNLRMDEIDTFLQISARDPKYTNILKTFTKTIVERNMSLSPLFDKEEIETLPTKNENCYYGTAPFTPLNGVSKTDKTTKSKGEDSTKGYLDELFKTMKKVSLPKLPKFKDVIGKAIDNIPFL